MVTAKRAALATAALALLLVVHAGSASTGSRVEFWDDDDGEDANFAVPEPRALGELQDICSDIVVPACTPGGTLRKTVIVFDVSKSLFRNWMYTEGLAFVQKLGCTLLTNPASKLALVTFAGDIIERVPLAPYAADVWAEAVETSMVSDTSLGRECCSPLAEALEYARSMLESDDDANGDSAMEEFAELVIVISDGMVYPNEAFATYSGRTWPATQYSPDAYRMQVVPSAAGSVKEAGIDLMFVGQSGKRGNNPDQSWVLGTLSGYCAGDECFSIESEAFPIVSAPYETFALFPGHTDLAMGSSSLPEWNEPSTLAEIVLDRLCEEQEAESEQDDDDDGEDAYSSNESKDDEEEEDDDEEGEDDENDDYDSDDSKTSNRFRRTQTTARRAARDNNDPPAVGIASSQVCGGETPRDLVVLVDGSASIDPATFYGVALDLAETALVMAQEGSAAAQTQLVVIGQELEEILPLEARDSGEIYEAISNLRVEQDVAFGCCSPFAYVFEKVLEDLEVRSAPSNLPFVLLISDGRPHQNLRLESDFAFLQQGHLDHAEYVTKQVPGSAWMLKSEAQATLAFVGIPGRDATPADTDYFTEAALTREVCASSKVKCFTQEVPIVSEPTAAFAKSLGNGTDAAALEDLLSRGLREMICDTTPTPLQQNYPEYLVFNDGAASGDGAFAAQSGEAAAATTPSTNVQDYIDDLLQGLQGEAVLGGPRDLVVAVDASQSTDAASLRKELGRIVLQLAQTLYVAQGSQFGLVLYDEVVQASGTLPLAARSLEETQHAIAELLLEYPWDLSGQSSALGEALRTARLALAASPAKARNEQLVVVLTAANPHVSTHWRAHYARDGSNAKYMARSVPFEARALWGDGVRVVVAAGPNRENQTVVNRAYFAGQLRPDYEFCEDGRCFAYQGGIASDPVAENLVFLNAWGQSNVKKGILPLVALASTNKTIVEPTAVPTHAPGPSRLVFVLDDTVSAAEHQEHISVLQATQTRLAEYSDDVVASVYIASCSAGVKRLLEDGGAEHLQVVLESLQNEPASMANSTLYRCASPLLIRAREICEKAGPGSACGLTLVYLTGRDGRVEDLTSAIEASQRLPHWQRHFQLLAYVPGQDDGPSRMPTDLQTLGIPRVASAAEIMTHYDAAAQQLKKSSRSTTTA